MIEQLPELINSHEEIVHRGRFINEEIMIIIGAEEYRVVIKDGVVSSVLTGPFLMRPCSIVIRASKAAWQKFWQQYPPPGYNDILAMIKLGEAEVVGDWRVFIQNLRYFKDLLEAPRKLNKENGNA
ncbi:hypothetical protein ACFLW3_01855 [Chloroflexota bacterium]